MLNGKPPVPVSLPFLPRFLYWTVLLKGVGKTGRLLGDAAAVILRASPGHSSAPAGWIEVEQDTNKISKRVNVPGCHRNSF